MRSQIQELRFLVEGADERLYVDDDVGLARLIALGTPGVTSSDSDHEAAGKAISHLRLLIRRRSLLAKAFRLARNQSRSRSTLRKLRRKVQYAS